MGAIGRAALCTAAATATALIGWYPAGATAAPPDPQHLSSRLAGTWGACGSWWTQTPTQSESVSVCGVDGLVTENGRPTQLAEPLVSVARYICFKRRPTRCQDQSWTGTVRRSEMTVDPFLRRASIRGTLGGCTLDVEFAGLAPAKPEGSLWESYGLTDRTPTVSIGGTHTFTSQASWWGGVCGRTVTPQPDQAQAWMFRGAEASLSHQPWNSEGGASQ
jgi:hypothetical protein